VARSERSKAEIRESELLTIMRVVNCLLAACLFLLAPLPFVSAATSPAPDQPKIEFPKPLDEYHDDQAPNLFDKLLGRAKAEPYNLIATFIFLCAIVHTFLTSRFMHISHAYRHEFQALELQKAKTGKDQAISARQDALQFRAQLFHFMGEIEAVFGIWLIPLGLAIVLMKGWPTLVAYITSISPAEPVFVVVIMAMASSLPVLRFAETLLAKVAAFGHSTAAAWWLSILTVGPLLGSLITEPAAMTICALLLREKFYSSNPGTRLSYATLGLLFVNISVGGTLSHFAAPPVVMVASSWDWDFSFMLSNFGWKAVVGIFIANLFYYLLFRKEISALNSNRADHKEKRRPVPLQITIVHLLFLAWTVFTSHYPSLVVLGFLFFLAFMEATGRHQSSMNLRGPMLVGFFLGSLVIHGRCQQWWIAPLLGGLSEWPLLIGAVLLTAFNDNAAITYLASLVPGFSPSLKYAVMAGAVSGGGLTVIANAPNPAGQSLLAPAFGEDGIAPAGLFAAALFPTIIVAALFMVLP
jgi:Putative Na+/H+ antiporter